MSDTQVHALYENLARLQWWRARRGVAEESLDGLEMRKRLAPPAAGDGPADGGPGLDHWLRSIVGGVEGSRVVDVGCGFGASLLRAVDAGAVRCSGFTPSEYQVARARRVAAARGVGPRCGFEVAKIDRPLPPADVVLAVESLGHTRDLRTALRSVADACRAGGGGRFLWLEDLLAEPAAEDPDVRALSRAWSSPTLRSIAEAEETLRAAGLNVVASHDLSGQVVTRDIERLDRARRALSLLRRAVPVPFLRSLSAAFLGGIHLERLYARRLVRYRLVVAAPAAAAADHRFGDRSAI